MTDLEHGDAVSRYQELRRQRPELFINPPGAAVRIKSSMPAGGGPYGVCYQDSYITVLRDPVEFAGGRTGGHVRIMPSAGEGGAAVLPVHGEHVVLIRHFRHSTRQWHWEIPRGFSEPGETIEQTARRELQEEIGVAVQALTPLGRIHTDTGISGGSTGLFWAGIEAPGSLSGEEDDEGIERIALFDVDELNALQDQGELTDSFTLAAILGARRRRLPPFA